MITPSKRNIGSSFTHPKLTIKELINDHPALQVIRIHSGGFKMN